MAPGETPGEVWKWGEGGRGMKECWNWPDFVRQLVWVCWQEEDEERKGGSEVASLISPLSLLPALRLTWPLSSFSSCSTSRGSPECVAACRERICRYCSLPLAPSHTHVGGATQSLSNPLRKGCSNASLAVSLREGSRVNIRSIRSRALSGIWL